MRTDFSVTAPPAAQEQVDAAIDRIDRMITEIADALRSSTDSEPLPAACACGPRVGAGLLAALSAERRSLEALRVADERPAGVVGVADVDRLLHFSGLALIVLDTEGRVRFFSSAACAYFPLGTDAIGRFLVDPAAHAGDTSTADDIKAALCDEVVVERDVIDPADNCHRRVVAPLRDGKGQVDGVVITMVDVSARHREAMRAAAAGRAARTMYHFLAAAGTELRQRLQSLRLIHGLLQRCASGHGVGKLLARLDAVIAGLAGTLDGVIEVQRIEAGLVEPCISDFSLDTILAPIEVELRRQAASAGIDGRVVPCRWRVRSDPRLVGQMIRHIVANAVRNTPFGRVLVGARLRGDRIAVEIWDTGLGLSEATRARIVAAFDPGRVVAWRAGAEAATDEEHLGLGLAMVQHLAARLGLEVDIRSELGRGSVFTVLLPLAPATEMTERPAKELDAARASISHGAALADRTGLIVADDPDLREMLEITLQSAGMRTLSAADLIAAVRLPAEVDIIVTDQRIPGGPGGEDVVARLQQKLRRTLPAILLADHDGPVNPRIGRLGIEVIVKPAESALLIETAARLLADEDMATTTTGGEAVGRVVSLIDANMASRTALRRMIASEGFLVRSYASVEAFLAGAPNKDGCVIVDADLAGGQALHLGERLAAEGITVPVIVVSGRSDVHLAVEAMRGGAADFVELPVGHAELVRCIRRVIETSRRPAPAARVSVLSSDKVRNLTQRQRQILDMVLAGHPSKNIAAALSISQRTVENHRAAIMRKMGSRSLPALIRTVLAGSAGIEIPLSFVSGGEKPRPPSEAVELPPR